MGYRKVQLVVSTWVFYSLIALIATMLSAIFIRKLHVIGVPFRLQVSMQFIFPFLGFLVWSLFELKLLEINLLHLILIFIYAILFIQLGTILSVRAITLSHNAGYAMAISRINVLIATFISVFMFGSYLSFLTLVSTLIIFISSLFLLDYSSAKGSKSNLWFWYALAGGVLTSGYAIGSKYFIIENIPFLTRMFYSFFAMGLVSGIDLLLNRTKIKVKQEWVVWLLGLGFVTFLFNIVAQYAFEFAPNPGFVNAFIAASIVPTIFLSAYWFKDELKLKKIIGVVGILIGLILLYIPKYT